MEQVQDTADSRNTDISVAEQPVVQKQKRGPGRPSKKTQIFKKEPMNVNNEQQSIDDTLCIKYINKEQKEKQNEIEQHTLQIIQHQLDDNEPDPSDPFTKNDYQPFQQLSTINENNIIGHSGRNDKQQFPQQISKLLNFQNENLNGEQWPQFTSICCFHCIHQFREQPIGIPVSYKDGKYIMDNYIFCSFECAVAYLLNNLSYNKQEKYSLLCQLAIDMGYVQKIQPAMPTKFLKCFGGPYLIEEFRSMSKKYSSQEILVSVQPPPMYPQELLTININNTSQYDTHSCISSQNSQKRQTNKNILQKFSNQH